MPNHFMNFILRISFLTDIIGEAVKRRAGKENRQIEQEYQSSEIFSIAIRQTVEIELEIFERSKKLHLIKHFGMRVAKTRKYKKPGRQ